MDATTTQAVQSLAGCYEQNIRKIQQGLTGWKQALTEFLASNEETDRVIEEAIALERAGQMMQESIEDTDYLVASPVRYYLVLCANGTFRFERREESLCLPIDLETGELRFQLVDDESRQTPQDVRLSIQVEVAKELVYVAHEVLLKERKALEYARALVLPAPVVS